MDRLKHGVVAYVCLVGKKCKSLQLKLESVVVELRVCFLLIVKVRQPFPWRSLACRFAVVRSQLSS